MRMSWTNGGGASIEGGAWAVYLTHSPIDPRNIFPNGTLLGNSGLRVHHVNGALNRIEPTPAFAPLPPGQTLDIEFVCGGAQAARFYIMPNWYAVSTDPACEDASVIENTVGETLDWVEDFTRPDQWKRSSWDLYNPYTPAERYTLDFVEDRDPLPPRSVVPRPAEELWDPARSLDLGDEGWVIVQPAGELIFDADYLAEALGLPIVPVNPPRRYISLRLTDPATWPPRPTELEGYLLTVDADFEVIAVSSIASDGVFTASRPFSRSPIPARDA
jgi:hexosaminidase